MQIIPFEELARADLIVDAIYESSHDGQLSGEPISKLLPGMGNMGGFRSAGRGDDKKLVVLFSTGEDKDWPDSLDVNTGQFVYFGDNKTPGHELHDTQKGGNKLLRLLFERLHDPDNARDKIPPILIFKKYPTENGARSVQFKGLAVPGSPNASFIDDLVAIWKTTNGQRFQNYRSVFTVLDVAKLNRAWLSDILSGNNSHDHPPLVWREWNESGQYQALTSNPTTIIRSDSEQLPDTPLKRQILAAIWQHFNSDNETEKKRRALIFEQFSARLFQMHDQRVIVDEITRGAVDGGRDAFGRYLLGLDDDPVYAEFSLEAKCYRPGIDGMTANTIGVKETARLISRIRHREFGILVTTSVVARQAYEEVRSDRHPIIFICGKDIVEILMKTGYNTVSLVQQFLSNEFSVAP